MTEKRFDYTNYDDGTESIYDGKKDIYYFDSEFCKLDEVLNELEEENDQLKQFISKIDFAIIRKYDNSLENLLDEVYDGEYENWIKKQVSRAKKLDGDVE